MKFSNLLAGRMLGLSVCLLAAASFTAGPLAGTAFADALQRAGGWLRTPGEVAKKALLALAVVALGVACFASGQLHIAAPAVLEGRIHRSLTAPIEGYVAAAPARLLRGGWLLLEHGFDQRHAVMALLRGAGFVTVFSRRDPGGHWRVSGGRLP